MVNIVSKFKDYYDYVFRQNPDPLYYWDRVTKCEPNWFTAVNDKSFNKVDIIRDIRNRPLTWTRWWSPQKFKLTAQDLSVGFLVYGNKVLSFVYCSRHFYNDNISTPVNFHKTKYESSCISYNLDPNDHKITIMTNGEIFSFQEGFDQLIEQLMDDKSYQQFLQDAELSQQIVEKHRDEIKAPLALFFEKEIYLNPWLSNSAFSGIVEPYQICQEIAMWIANQSVNDVPLANQSNKEKVVSHGFDYRTSFRNA